MRYVSLFAGIGGFDLALNRLGHVCVWANEWDKYAAQIYNKNFGKFGEWTRSTECVRLGRNSTDSKGELWEDNKGDVRPLQQEGSEESGECKLIENKPYEWKHLGNGIDTRDIRYAALCDTRDIRTVPTSEIPDHDILTAGFPCQAFSIAGKRRGFDDTRGTLFFEVARILKDKQPKFFILENVKGLLSHDNGNTFKTIISTLTELGYDLQWQVLNSKNFGVPQNRERVFIVGHLRGQPRPEVFPIGTSNTENEPERVLAHTLNSSDWRGANRNQKQTTIRTDEQNTQKRGDKSNTTNTIRRTSYTDDMRIRRLTPTECERLQGFPDGFTEGVSDTQRYKTLGNAVTVNVVYEVAKRLNG
jgi:DNA (cytosine-5)-methyltransferase 1